jgi:hypothetical protein
LAEGCGEFDKYHGANTSVTSHRSIRSCSIACLKTPAVPFVLIETIAAHPECEMTVLCGHTHSSGEVSVLPNLRVVTGGAEYGSPET